MDHGLDGWLFISNWIIIQRLNLALQIYIVISYSAADQILMVNIHPRRSQCAKRAVAKKWWIERWNLVDGQQEIPFASITTAASRKIEPTQIVTLFEKSHWLFAGRLSVLIYENWNVNVDISFSERSSSLLGFTLLHAWTKIRLYLSQIGNVGSINGTLVALERVDVVH